MGKLAFVLMVSAFVVQSEPPSPRTGKPAQNNQGKPASKQSISTQNEGQANSVSTAINKLSSEVTAWKNQQAAEDNKRDTSSGGWLMWSTIMTAVATLAIAGLGGFQWWAMHKQRVAMELQAAYMKDALAETNKSADAAVIAANVAKRSLEVAYQAKVGIASMTLIDPWARARIVDDNATLSRCCIEMVLMNTGPTVARNFSFEYLIDIYDLEGLINAPVMIHCDPTDLHPSIPFQKVSLPIHSHFPDANVLWRYAVEGRNLTVSGSFSYWDIFGNQFKVGYFGKITSPPTPFMNPIAIPFEVNTETNSQ